jgi:hypothetical protein
MRSLRPHLTYANVMSTIAVVLALGGATALAAGHLKKNSVNSKAIKNGAVKTADLKNSAVTTGKLGNNAVDTGKIAANAISTGKIDAKAVTGGKIAADTVTGANVNEGTLHPRCNFPVGATSFQLPGGGLCAFTAGGAASFATSLNFCRGGATGGTLPTVAEFEQIAAVTGSPFRGIVAWTTSVTGGVTPMGAIVTTDAAGGVTSISQTDLTLAATTTTACVYDPASAPLPGS